MDGIAVDDEVERLPHVGGGAKGSQAQQSQQRENVDEPPSTSTPTMAALLSDQIDSLNRRTRSIKAVASQIAPTAPSTRSLNPFTQAVLYAEIGDLIRDVEATELGLFTLIKSAGTSDPNERQLRRVDFVGATPLKKVPARREERAVEVPPEVYTEAALKFLRT